MVVPVLNYLMLFQKCGFVGVPGFCRAADGAWPITLR
jgi:hypothetical protein